MIRFSERHCFRLLLILALGLTVRLHFARFYYPVGDTVNNYFPAVLNLLSGLTADFPIWEQWHVRLGIILPLSFWQYVTANSIVAVPATGLLFSLLQILLTYRIGARLWNRETGLLAALLESIYPLAVIWGSQAIPDPIVSCMITAAVLLCLRALSANPIDAIAAGACVGLAYTAKISGLFALPIATGIWWIRRRQSSPFTLVLGAGGFLLVLAAETAVLSILAERVVFRPHMMMGANVELFDQARISWSRYFPGFFAAPFWPLDRGFLFHGLFGAAATVAAFLGLRAPKSSELKIVIGWLLGLLLLANFAGLGFDSPIYRKLHMRNIMFITPPACLLIAWATLHLRALVPVTYRIVLVGVPATTGLACSYLLHSSYAPYDAGHKYLIGQLEKHCKPSTTVFFHDNGSPRRMELTLNRGSFSFIEGAHPLRDAAPGDMAVLLVSGYTPLDEIPRDFVNTIRRPPWQHVSELTTPLSLASRAFIALGIDVKKGHSVTIQLFRMPY